MISQKIDNSNKEYFKGLFSENVYAQINADNTVSIGALDEDSSPVGALMIKLVDESQCQLMWLYTAENKRRNGVASYLWSTLSSVLSKNNISSVSYMATSNDLDNGIWNYCASIGGQQYNCEYIIPTVKAALVFSNLSKTSTKSIQSLAHVSTKLATETINDFKSKNQLYKMCPSLWQDLSLIRMNSFCISTNNSIDSLALCIPRDTNDGLIVFDINCSPKTDFLNLVKAICEHAINTYGNNALISLYTIKGVELEITSRYGGQESILYLYPCLLPLRNE